MSCPICSEPSETAFRPFCSKRCADIDLGRWMLGSYAIPMVEDDAVEDVEISERSGFDRTRQN